MEETVLREQLRTVDESLLFLLLIVLSVLLSYWGVRIQREGLCRTLQGDAEGAAALPRVFPIRLSASALVVVDRPGWDAGGPAVGVHQPVGLPVCLSRRPAAAGRPAGHPGCLGGGHLK